MYYGGVLVALLLGLCGAVNSSSRTRGWWSRRGNPTRSTSPPPTSSTPPSTAAPGCEYNGHIYPPGSQFGEGYDAGSNWCYGAACTKNSELIHWDNFNCKSTSPRPTTASPSDRRTSATTVCNYNGQQYPANTDIENGYDSSSDWCYGTYCDGQGNILAWDKWNCRQATTVPPMITTLPTQSERALEAPKVNQAVLANGRRANDKLYASLGKLQKLLNNK